MKKPWYIGQMPRSFWAHIIMARWGHYITWKWMRSRAFPDQWEEDVREAVETYCMGGEL